MRTTRTRARRSPTLVSLGILAALLGSVGLVGCSRAAAELPDHPLPAAFDDGVPEPSGEVTLTVTADDAEHEWDLATLGLLPQHDLTIIEPFVEEEHTYTGPLWADVLRASGVDLAAAGPVEVVALNDYVADLATDAEALDGLLLAHLEDGEQISVADGGPLRLVFPPDNPAGENLNNWVWSVRTASVE